MNYLIDADGLLRHAGLVGEQPGPEERAAGRQKLLDLLKDLLGPGAASTAVVLDAGLPSASQPTSRRIDTSYIPYDHPDGVSQLLEQQVKQADSITLVTGDARLLMAAAEVGCQTIGYATFWAFLQERAAMPREEVAEESGIICPGCQFVNEEGTLFCEKCKSDLTVASAIPSTHVETPAREPGQTGEAPQPEDEQPATVPLELGQRAPSVTEEPRTERIPSAPSASPLASSSPPAPLPSPVAVPSAAPPSDAPPAEPRLIVVRGQKRNVEYPICEGQNYIGRADEQAVDIDLEGQEPPDRVWISRQHALIRCEGNRLFLEDLNSANGTFLNRRRIHPGEKQPLSANDIIQIGNVQLKVLC